MFLILKTDSLVHPVATLDISRGGLGTLIKAGKQLETLRAKKTYTGLRGLSYATEPPAIFSGEVTAFNRLIDKRTGAKYAAFLQDDEAAVFLAKSRPKLPEGVTHFDAEGVVATVALDTADTPVVHWEARRGNDRCTTVTIPLATVAEWLKPATASTE